MSKLLDGGQTQGSHAELLAQDAKSFAIPPSRKHKRAEGQDNRHEDDGIDEESHLYALGSRLFCHAPALSLSLAQSLPDISMAVWHLVVLLPAALLLSALSHLVLPRSMWKRGGGPHRLSWPVSRCSGWSVRETAAVAVVSHLLSAFRHVSRTPLCPSAERLIPLMSHSCFGIKHQGWSLSGRPLDLDPLPEEMSINLSSETQGVSDGEGIGLKRHTGLGSDLDDGRSDPDLQYSAPCILLWKAHASAVSQHQVQAVKPAVNVGGVGSGRAGPDERVLLLLSGSSYADRDPIAGLLACNLVNTTGLRTLSVNWRKATPCSAGEQGAFPAGLNDAIRAYVHLVRNLQFRPENVYLIAEGSGAGLAMGVMMWLSALQTGTKAAPSASTLGRPGKVVLWSPWCDLTMRSPTWKSNRSFDIVSHKASRTAASLYASSVRRHLTSSSLEAQVKQAIENTCNVPDRAPLRTPSPLQITPDLDSSDQPSFTSALESLSKGSKRPAQLKSRSTRQEYSGASDSGVELEGTLVAPSPVSLKADTPNSLQLALASAFESYEATCLAALLVSSIPILGAEHPMLSPALPFSDLGSPHDPENRPFHRAVFSLLAADHLPKTDYLIFCGTESVLEGEAASLARNLNTVLQPEDEGAEATITASPPSASPTQGKQKPAQSSSQRPQNNGSVTYLRAVETPTLFNLMPTSVFLPHAQAKAESVVHQFLVGDAERT